MKNYDEDKALIHYTYYKILYYIIMSSVKDLIVFCFHFIFKFIFSTSFQEVVSWEQDMKRAFNLTFDLSLFYVLFEATLKKNNIIVCMY